MTGNKKYTTYFLSAADRNNYGDLLFPVIASEILSRHNIEIRNFGIVNSDLEYFGAKRTSSYFKFLKEIKIQKNPVIIIGGGQVLFAEWRIIFQYINKLFYKMMKFKFFRRLENKLKISRIILSNNQVRYPYNPTVQELGNKNVIIIYNSVGGWYSNHKSLEEVEHFKTSLDDGYYVSVRDTRTLESVNKLGCSGALVPDTAVIISDLFNSKFLLEKCEVFESIIESSYIFLQLGHQYIPENLDELKNNLEKLSDELKLRIVLCPIGISPGHDDLIALKILSSFSEKFTIVVPNNIFQVMGLIANSKFYLGTSLHGAITAQSFGVPFLPFKANDKVRIYFETWHPEIDIRSISVENFSKIKIAFENWENNYDSKKTEYQKQLVYKHFDKMISIIQK